MMNYLNIRTDFQSFSEETSIEFAIQFFRKTHFSHFPVTKRKVFLGMISKKDVLSIEHKQKKIKEVAYVLHPFKAKNTVSFLELLGVFSTNKTNVLPVVRNEKYKGYVILQEFVNQIGTLPVFKHNSFILVVEKEEENHSFSEISQIIESNKGTILGMSVVELNEPNIRIEIRFKTFYFNEILQAFRRYDYQVVSKHQEDYYSENLEENSEYLERYLSI